MPYSWPGPLDDPQGLLALLGSFWSEVYAGNDLVAGLLAARAQLDQQSQEDFQELLACLSRLKVPIYRTVLWHQLTLHESQLNSPNLAHWDGSYAFNTGLAYDVSVPSTGLFAWAAPQGLAGLLAAANGIHGQSLVWTAGFDFYLANGAIWFAQNPFTAPGITIREVFDGTGAQVDRECDVWLYRSQWDLGAPHTQFGYVLEDWAPPSSRAYRDFINAGFDSLVGGETPAALSRLVAAACDVPVAQGGETVQYASTDANKIWIVTDQQAYGFALTNTVLVTPGQVLAVGDALVDAAQVFSFSRGQVPDEIKALALGNGFLAVGFVGELVFENKTVPLTVDENVDGYTKVSFEVGGLPGDVEQFWTEVHAAGVVNGQTLAMLLDQRPAANRTTQPTAVALQTTINPLGFLLNNCFRDNLLVAVVKPLGFGPNAIGLNRLSLLKRLIPPHTALIVLVQLEFTETPITMDPDNPPGMPGYSETAEIFLGMSAVEDAMDPAVYVTEIATCSQVGGKCA